MVLALSGNSPVDNAFTDEAERLGLTPQAREKKEREEERRAAQFAAEMREETLRFQEQLDLLDQACMEAFRENEAQQGEAREELKRIRHRAYEITMPDGVVTKVYRDGDKVRTEDGAEVPSELVSAEDIGNTHSSWSQFMQAGRHLRELEAEHGRIVTYQKEVQDAHKRAGAGDLSPDDLRKLEERAEKNMPDSVRAKTEGAGTPRSKAAVIGDPVKPDTDSKLAEYFTHANKSNAREARSDGDNDATRLQSSPSAPAPM